MSKNLKSLKSGVLKCGASQFKANIPSIQGVTLAPATENPVNFVFEVTKEAADTFLAAISSASIPHASENYLEGETEMVRIWLAMPVEPGAFVERGMTLSGYGRCYCYCSGVLPESFMVGMADDNADFYFVNSVSTTGDGVFLQIAGGKIVFMKDLALVSIIEAREECSIIINGNVSIDGGHINFAGVGTSLETPNILVLGNVEQESDIDASSFVGDITYLYYNGEWNTTTRAWIDGSVYFLNGKSLDPLPEQE